MSKLLSYDDVKSTADFYFTDAHWSWDKKQYVFNWPSKDFPYAAYIHEKNLDNVLRISIRKWVDKNTNDVVIYRIIDHTYRHMTGPDFRWDRSFEVTNYWYGFYFAEEAECLLFKLAFADVVTPKTLHHPDYPEDEEFCKLTPGERVDYYEKARNSKKD